MEKYRRKKTKQNKTKRNETEKQFVQSKRVEMNSQGSIKAIITVPNH